MKYIKTYEDKVTVDLKEDEKIFLMQHAARTQNYSMLKRLLEAGFNVNIAISSNSSNTTLLYEEAIKKNPDLEIIQLYIDYGANVNYTDTYHAYPLAMFILRAATTTTNKQTLVEILIKLIKAGANFNAKFIDETFFDLLERRLEKNKKIKDKILNAVKEFAPAQYKEYEISKDSKKYNL